MYCVNCGVKLAPSEQKCPLCGTTVYHSEIQMSAIDPPYPPERMPPTQVRPKAALIVCTFAWLLPTIISLQCDMLIHHEITWSGYVVGALVLSYITIVLPFWFRKPNPVAFIPVDFAVTAAYLMYINHATGCDWFWPFAFPLVCALCILVTAVTALLRYIWKGRFYIIGGGFLALGLLMPLVELLLCNTFQGVEFWGWSFFPLTALTLLGGMLIFLAICRPAREHMERRFFF